MRNIYNTRQRSMDGGVAYYQYRVILRVTLGVSEGRREGKGDRDETHLEIERFKISCSRFPSIVLFGANIHCMRSHTFFILLTLKSKSSDRALKSL